MLSFSAILVKLNIPLLYQFLRFHKNTLRPCPNSGGGGSVGVPKLVLN